MKHNIFKITGLSALIVLLSISRILAQCNVSILADSLPADTVSICYGDTLVLEASGSCTLMSASFDSQAMGAGWNFASPNLMFGSPCQSGTNNTAYLWFGPNVAPQRKIITDDFNVLAGGNITFDLVFGIQNNPVPCEGPDAMNEGVSLQYSTDQGNTWNDVVYFCPNGSLLPHNPDTLLPLTYGITNFTSWHNYNFPIPPEARTAATRFRWIQATCNFFNGHYDDNWGLDNIQILRSINEETSWAHGPAGVNPPTVHPLTDTTYIVYVTNYEFPYDTVAVDSLFVNVLPVPDAVLSADHSDICLGATANLTAGGNWNYAWSTGDSTASINVTPAQSAYYTVTVSNIFGCSDSDSLLITVLYPPDPDLSDTTICSGQSLVLYAGDAASYQWSTGDTGPTLTVTPPVTTSFSVTVTGQNGCIASADMQVTVLPLPQTSITGDRIICYGEQTTLAAHGANHYSWSNGVEHAVNTVAPLANTLYILQSTGYNGCSTNDTVLVMVNPFHEVTAMSPQDTICRGNSAILSVAGGMYYEWSNGETSPEIQVRPSITTTYEVAAYDTTYGLECVVRLPVTVEMQECNTLHIPNAFSPKGYNQVFRPIGDLDQVRNYILLIYNRFGENLFTTNNPSEGWNGTYRGEEVNAGVYVYRVRYTNMMGETFDRAGSVTLLK